MAVSDIPTIVNTCLEIVETYEDEYWHALDSLGEHYRIHVDNNLRLSCHEYVPRYSIFDVHSRVMNIHDDTGHRIHDTLDLLYLYRDWAFLNGFRNSSPEEQTIPVDDWGDIDSRRYMDACNDIISTHENITPQDAFIGMKIAEKVCKHASTGIGQPVDLKTASEHLDFFEQFNEVMAELITRAEAVPADFEWDKVGGTIDFMYTQLNEQANFERGQRSVIQSIYDSELSPNDWFNKHESEYL